jgi:Arc/MetJ-type ribon-helix-helix transcriptional regulator
MTGTSAYIDDEAAALADILVERYQRQIGSVARVSRSSVIRQALWSQVQADGLDEAWVRAEVQRRLAARGK